MTMTITSSHNEKLKEIRKLARRRARDERGRFVAEGEDLVAAAKAAGWNPVVVLAAAGSGLEGVGDPGNVGTILRSARAFGAASVALGPGCADPYGPKAVRASMGAIFEVPVAHVARVEELPGEGVARVAHAGEPLAGPASGEPSLLLGPAGSRLPDHPL